MRMSLRTTLAGCLTALVSVALASGTLLAPPSAAGSSTLSGSSTPSGVSGASSAFRASARETRLLAKVNAARASRGVPALRASPYLASYARQHARSMAARGGLFHTANFNVLCCWTAVGENIARYSTVTRAHVALMNSPPHRANLLNPTFRQVGIGIVKSGGKLWVTQVFRRKA